MLLLLQILAISTAASALDQGFISSQPHRHAKRCQLQLWAPWATGSLQQLCRSRHLGSPQGVYPIKPLASMTRAPACCRQRRSPRACSLPQHLLQPTPREAHGLLTAHTSVSATAPSAKQGAASAGQLLATPSRKGATQLPRSLAACSLPQHLTANT